MFACAFLPATAGGGSSDGGGGGGGANVPGLLAAAYSTGAIRVYDCRRASALWLGARRAAAHAAQWRAHEGGAYALAVAGAATNAPVLLSCGDDGLLKGWSVAAIAEVVAAQQQLDQELVEQQLGAATGGAAAASGSLRGGARDVALKPLFEARLPRAEPPFPVAAPAAPAAQAVAVDEARGAVYVGASDGGVHAFDIQRLGEAAAAALAGSSSGGGGGVRSSSGGGSGGTEPVVTLSGHAAAVLGMDCCAATGQVATASEDATVRVWDARVSAPCVAALDVARGAALAPGSKADALRCARAPPATCVRFDAGGGWLVAGSGFGGACSSGSGGANGGGGGGGGGGGDGSLALFSLGLGALAKRISTGACTPQALRVLPGEVLMVGSEPALRRYRFSLESASAAELACESAFALDVHPATGTVAAGGAKGGALVSPYGTRLGRIAG